VRLKGQVMDFQSHHQPYESDTWLWKYDDFSKIPRLIFTHHGRVKFGASLKYNDELVYISKNKLIDIETK